MRLVSATHDGRELVGVVDDERVVPLGDFREIGATTPLAALRQAPRHEERAVPLDEVVLRPVVPHPEKIVCVGLNYAEHVAENERSSSAYPVLFTKFASALVGPFDPIVIPAAEDHADYEAEIAVVIGEAGRRISRADALRHVAGLTLANDVTMRDFQYRTHQWLQGKAWESTTPLGPALVTLDELDYRNLTLRLTLNGRVMQEASTAKMIFDVPTLVSTISEFTSLEAGDVILTGTPGGVGYRRDPQVSLRDGDAVVVEAAGLGRIVNRVRVA